MVRYSRAIIFACFLFARTAQAFIFLPGPADDDGTRALSKALKAWTNPAVFHLNPSITALGGSETVPFTSAQWVSAVETAVAAWNDVNCRSDLSITLETVSSSSTPATLDDKRHIIFDNRSSGSTFCAGAGTLGCASYVVSETYNSLRDCDIYISFGNTQDLVIGGQSGKYDVISVLVHEIGHCMGLDHAVQEGWWESNNSFLTNAIMNANLSANTLKQALTQDEQDYAQCVHQKSADSRNACDSYHGTNGGAALSGGGIAGGPTAAYTPNCGQNAVTARSKAGSAGCIQNAIANEDGSIDYESSYENLISWLSWFFVCFLSWISVRLLLRLKSR